MTKKLLTVTLIYCFFFAGNAFAFKQPNNKGQHTRTPVAMKDTLRTKWVTKLKKEKAITRRPYQFASPVIEDGMLYVGAASGYFYSIDLKKGKRLWDVKLDSGVYGEASGDNEYIYVADRKGVVYAIRKADGKIEWRTETNSEISSKPIVTGDTLYLSTTLKQVVAINRSGGGVKWQTQKIGSIPQMTIKGSSSPLLYNGRLYVGYADGMFYSYNALNGNIEWVKMLASRGADFVDVDTSPIIKDDTIFVSIAEGKTFALDPDNGNIIWSAQAGGSNDPYLAGDVLYASGLSKMSALDPSSGAVLWERTLDEPEISSPVVQGDKVVFMSTVDKIYILNRNTGDITYKRFLGKGCFGKPLLFEDTIYILGNSSALFSLR